MVIQPIKNAASHAAALAQIEALMSAKRDTPDPIEAISFRMDQSGLVVKDLVPCIGPINRVYEVLAH